MTNPELDIEDRKPIWNVMQMVWMDTDIKYEYENIANTCAKSKYSISELEAIYWNEVYPCVRSNLWILIAPEWCGYELEWLAKYIVKKNRFGQKLLKPRMRFYSFGPWEEIRLLVIKKRRKLMTKKTK